MSIVSTRISGVGERWLSLHANEKFQEGVITYSLDLQSYIDHRRSWFFVYFSLGGMQIRHEWTDLVTRDEKRAKEIKKRSEEEP